MADKNTRGNGPLFFVKNLEHWYHKGYQLNLNHFMGSNYNFFTVISTTMTL